MRQIGEQSVRDRRPMPVTVRALIILCACFAVGTIVYLPGGPKRGPKLTGPSGGPSRRLSPANVFIPKNRTCKFYLPVSIPGSGMSKMCTYDPDVDHEISLSIKVNQKLYSENEVNAVLSIMNRERQSMTNQKGAAGSEISLVDVGCNIGIFTLTAALNGYKVLAVDAMNSSLQLLGTSLRLQNRLSQVTLVHNAIADARKDVHFQITYPNNIGASRVVDTAKKSNANTQTTSITRTQVVKAICMDDLVPFVPTHRVFLKMDIEGSEWRALRCADRFFAKFDVPYIHMEWLFYKSVFDDKTIGDGIITFLTSKGYQACYPGNGDPLTNDTKRWPGNVLWIRKSRPVGDDPQNDNESISRALRKFSLP